MTASSPCVKVCVMDTQRGVCLGCCRTLAEIAAWGGMAEAERKRIMAGLPARRRELETGESTNGADAPRLPAA
jgi:hypothetical protein